jgi:hypothetical protein
MKRGNKRPVFPEVKKHLYSDTGTGGTCHDYSDDTKNACSDRYSVDTFYDYQ